MNGLRIASTKQPTTRYATPSAARVILVQEMRNVVDSDAKSPRPRDQGQAATLAAAETMLGMDVGDNQSFTWDQSHLFPPLRCFTLGVTPLTK